MNNVKIKTNGSKITIEIDVSKAAVQNAPYSSTGKTKLLASTGGAYVVPGSVPGLKIALNAMLPA